MKIRDNYIAIATRLWVGRPRNWDLGTGKTMRGFLMPTASRLDVGVHPAPSPVGKWSLSPGGSVAGTPN
jgi:hypothetical protein